MLKEVGAFSLIIFLFVILAAWWAVSSFEPTRLQGSNSNTVADTIHGSQPDSEVVQAQPITIYHSNQHGSEVYSGSVTIPSCDEFLTGISATGRTPAHLRLSFTVSKPSQQCQNSGMSSVPFTVSFSSEKNDTRPILDSVHVNNAAATFSLIEVK
jgi:hypothetical protein